MARKPRIQYPGAFYHVIARGNGGQKIFRDSQDYERYSYFLELSAYIHLNPVRGGLVKKPHQYPWSSYRFYVRDEKEMFVDGDFLQAQFSHKKTIAKRAYGL